MYDHALWTKYYLQVLMNLMEGKHVIISFFEEPDDTVPLEELTFKEGRYYVLTKSSTRDFDPLWQEINQEQAWTHARRIADRWMLDNLENRTQIQALQEEIWRVTREVIR